MRNTDFQQNKMLDTPTKPDRFTVDQQVKIWISVYMVVQIYNRVCLKLFFLNAGSKLHDAQNYNKKTFYKINDFIKLKINVLAIK